MPNYPYATDLADGLSAMLDHVPATVDVVQLPQPDVGSVQKRLLDLIGSAADVAGLEKARPKIETQKVRTLMRHPGGLRATGFHASGAMSVVLDLDAFEGLFDADPGDEALAALAQHTAERLRLRDLAPDVDILSFERLWRIKAAGGDEKGRVTEAVLCRAIGSFRHFVRELPVYGRASATVELAARGRLASVTLSMRRYAGDAGGDTVAKASVRSPDLAAQEVADRLVKAFGGMPDLKSTRLVPEWFRFGYLSLGRRHSQSLLAPFYVASVGIEREYEASAHVIAVPATEQQFVRLPSARRSSAPPRQAPTRTRLETAVRG